MKTIEEIKAYRQARYKAHAEEKKARNKANPEKRQAVFANWKAKKLGVPGKITATELEILFKSQKGICAICKKPCEKLSPDHIIPFTHSLCVNEIRNIQGVHLKCNNGKKDRILPEFQELLAELLQESEA